MIDESQVYLLVIVAICLAAATAFAIISVITFWNNKRKFR